MHCCMHNSNGTFSFVSSPLSSLNSHCFRQSLGRALQTTDRNSVSCSRALSLLRVFNLVSKLQTFITRHMTFLRKNLLLVVHHKCGRTNPRIPFQIRLQAEFTTSHENGDNFNPTSKISVLMHSLCCCLPGTHLKVHLRFKFSVVNTNLKICIAFLDNNWSNQKVLLVKLIDIEMQDFVIILCLISVKALCQFGCQT